jgi:hypothetical protein
MVKPSNFHGKDNTTPKELISFLNILEELFGEDYKKAKQVRITMVMLQSKAKVWWGHVKMDHEACKQPPMNTWSKFKRIFNVQYMLEIIIFIYMKEELIQLKQY